MAAASWCAGDHDRGRELARQFPRPDGLHFGHAIYYATAGQGDAMFEALDGAYQRRDFYLSFLSTLACFDHWRADQRFRSLLERMNLA